MSGKLRLPVFFCGQSGQNTNIQVLLAIVDDTKEDFSKPPQKARAKDLIPASISNAN